MAQSRGHGKDERTAAATEQRTKQARDTSVSVYKHGNRIRDVRHGALKPVQHIHQTAM